VGPQIAWVGNVAGGPAGQTLTVTYITDPAPVPPLAAITAVGTFNSTGSVSFDGIEAKPGNESFTVKIVGQ